MAGFVQARAHRQFLSLEGKGLLETLKALQVQGKHLVQRKTIQRSEMSGVVFHC